MPTRTSRSRSSTAVTRSTPRSRRTSSIASGRPATRAASSSRSFPSGRCPSTSSRRRRSTTRASRSRTCTRSTWTNTQTRTGRRHRSRGRDRSSARCGSASSTSSDPELRPPAEQIHFPTTEQIGDYSARIEDLGGADVCYGGIGWCGHIAFWESHLGFEFEGDLEAYKQAGARLVELHPMTIMQNALHSFGGDWSWVPPKAEHDRPARDPRREAPQLLARRRPRRRRLVAALHRAPGRARPGVGARPGLDPADGSDRLHDPRWRRGRRRDPHGVTELLSEETVGDYLIALGLVESSGAVEAHELGGGVSNVVLAVTSERDGMVVKQSLPRLRVDQEWLAKRERVADRSRGVEACRRAERGCRARSSRRRRRALRDRHRSGSRRMAKLEGRLARRATPTRAVAARLGGPARHLAPRDGRRSRDRPSIRRRRGLRAAPGRSVPPDGDGTVAQLERSDRPVRRSDAGDARVPRPRRLLAEERPRRRRRAVGLDFEVAHVGDPVFDLAFMHEPPDAEGDPRPDCTSMATAQLRARLLRRRTYAEAGDRARVRAAGSASASPGCLMVARVDGKSPAEYLTESERLVARSLGSRLLAEPALDRWPEPGTSSARRSPVNAHRDHIGLRLGGARLAGNADRRLRGTARSGAHGSGDRPVRRLDRQRTRPESCATAAIATADVACGGPSNP